MSVFTAMLKDSYRELNSKRLFWIILAISGFVVLAYASIGFDDRGVSMFFGLWKIENQFLVKGSPAAQILYRSLFSSFIVGIWLAWIATILALVSTATIFPDFLAAGSLDIVLSKPISRLRLFVYKYLTSLLFVTLQVSLFCVAILLCMGWRTGEWPWKVLLGIPVVVLFYSYLFSVMVFLGVWTRSSLTALLVTMLFWMSLFSVNTTETILNTIKTQAQIETDRSADRLGTLRVQMDQAEDEALRERIGGQIRDLEERREAQAKIVRTLKPWHAGVRTFQALVPKTNQTIGLLDRWLRKRDDISIKDIFEGNLAFAPDGRLVPKNEDDDRLMERRLQQDYESFSAWYVIGTSLIFEFVLLSGACWIFVRRDY